MKPIINLSIDGNKISHFEDIILEQSLNEHHFFRIILDHDAIETQGSHTLDKSKRWLGSSVVLGFGEKEFIGKVTEVRLTHEYGHHGHIVVSGFSDTILLENSSHNQSWLDTPLKKIVEDISDSVGLKVKVDTEYNASIEYQSQYKESHFDFLRRMSGTYHEGFYYDGVKLVFGKPQKTSTISLEYGKDASNIEISIEAKHNNFQEYGYNSLADQESISPSLNTSEGLNELGYNAFTSSDKLFSFRSHTMTIPPLPDKSQMDELLVGKQNTISSNLHRLHATSHKQGIGLGSVVKVSSALLKENNFEEKTHGEYFITRIKHRATGSGKYENNFEAVPSTIKKLPVLDYEFSQAETQIATVLSNDDPKGKGRIQVKFQWQTGEMKTSWIRVMSLDSGVSNYVEQNRGHVFIPEVGDQVMIGFEYNDPSRPFVMGSMFTGVSGAGGGIKNNIKTIITKSGHTIQFDDTSNAENITITDRKNNRVFIDTANDSILISANENIELKAKNISLTAEESITNNARNINSNASENISTGAGENISTYAGDTYNVSATDIKQRATNVFDRVAKNVSETAEKVAVDSTKENMELTSKKQIVSQSGEKIKLF
ncbi:type VI secretion system Vgr family protein [Aureivirga marina]|uniref:type VI secretion system Vgr family protein n=1 Tax=Aureivirga marina TaxID=1182451 RepID=UPI0018C93900|nr:phage baseplate assembly protein V [Aureivirga marina]